MIEIIAGVIVLILAIIGIAKLVQGRGGPGGGGKKLSFADISAAKQGSKNWKEKLASAMYNPDLLNEVFRTGDATSQDATAAIYGIQRLREQLREKYGLTDAQLEGYIEELNDISILRRTLFKSYDLLKHEIITDEEFRNYVMGDLKDLENMNERHERMNLARYHAKRA